MSIYVMTISLQQYSTSQIKTNISRQQTYILHREQSQKSVDS